MFDATFSFLFSVLLLEYSLASFNEVLDGFAECLDTGLVYEVFIALTLEDGGLDKADFDELADLEESGEMRFVLIALGVTVCGLGASLVTLLPLEEKLDFVILLSDGGL